MTPESLTRAMGSTWWRAAHAVAMTGQNVTVFDPNAGERESFWDGCIDHGSISILPSHAQAWALFALEERALPDTQLPHRRPVAEATVELEPTTEERRR